MNTFFRSGASLPITRSCHQGRPVHCGHCSKRTVSSKDRNENKRKFSFDLNECVERVCITIRFHPFPLYPFDESSDLSVYSQEEGEFSAAVQNLCTLNNKFVLHFYGGHARYESFQVGSRVVVHNAEYFKCAEEASLKTKLTTLMLGSQRLAKTAKEAGHPNVQIWVKIYMPHPRKKPVCSQKSMSSSTSV